MTYCSECHNPIYGPKVSEGPFEYHPECLKKKNGEKLDKSTTLPKKKETTI